MKKRTRHGGSSPQVQRDKGEKRRETPEFKKIDMIGVGGEFFGILVVEKWTCTIRARVREDIAGRG